jgi:hypothetical protein
MLRVSRRHIRGRGGGLDIDADINAVIAVNRGDSRTEAVESTSITQQSTARAQSGGREPEPDHRDETREDEQ